MKKKSDYILIYFYCNTLNLNMKHNTEYILNWENILYYSNLTINLLLLVIYTSVFKLNNYILIYFKKIKLFNNTLN